MPDQHTAIRISFNWRTWLHCQWRQSESNDSTVSGSSQVIYETRDQVADKHAAKCKKQSKAPLSPATSTTDGATDSGANAKADDSHQFFADSHQF
jgi:hypothetical protein